MTGTRPGWFRGHAGKCDLYLVELNPARTPSAPPRRLTTQRLQFVGSVTWTRDGSGVVYAAAAPAQDMYLWRVDADGTRPPERIEVAGSASDPAVALTRDRLAFVRDLFDLDIYRFEVGRPVQVVIGSNAPRMNPVCLQMADGWRSSRGVPALWGRFGSPTPTAQTRSRSRTAWRASRLAVLVTRWASDRIRFI